MNTNTATDSTFLHHSMQLFIYQTVITNMVQIFLLEYTLDDMIGAKAYLALFMELFFILINDLIYS